MTATMKASITFVSAGAGSGKTFRLTEILHRELTGNHIRPSGVIATTFTKKAATELRERVRGHLLKQGDFHLANAMGQARIGTVNSVCGQLIERFAFEAGMATEQQVLEEVQAALLLDKAIDAVMDGAAMSKFLIIVRRLGLDESRNDEAIPWKKDLQSLVNQVRANDIPFNRIAGFAAENASDILSHFPQPTQDDLSRDVLKAIKLALPAIEKTALEGGKKNTNEYLAQLRSFDSALTNGTATWGEWVRLAKSFPEVALKSHAEPIAALAGRVAEHPDLHADLTQYLEQIFNLAANALEIYAQNKREMGALDFADQEHLLLKLLDEPSVAETLSDELDLLMVDEFQDTSPIQLALFLKLAGFAKQVYWVGDIKQAIYGFRGSDTELMQAVLNELPAMGGKKEILPESWRSRPELVQLVNAVFGHAFANTLPKGEVELRPTRKGSLPGAALANWILGGKNQGEEASALASGVRKLVESKYQVIDKKTAASRDVRFGDIAILARLHSGVQNIANALSTLGIPSATARPGLLETPEATLALACLRRLNDQGDTIATAEIISMADGLNPETWIADRLRYLQAQGNADSWLEADREEMKAHPLIARIASLRTHLPLLAPREALQTLIAACDLSSRIVRWSPDPEKSRVRLANLEALLELANQYEDLCRSGQHAASISGLILWLGEIASDGKDMLAEPAIDAVKVMTHHAAKGLEWPVVILMDLAANMKDRLWSISAQPRTVFDIHTPLEDRFIRYWPWPFGAQQKVAVADEIALTPMAVECRRAAIEESKRLLYVSMTRARDLMVLARSSRKLSGEWLDCLDSPWLLQDEGADVLTMPDGETLKADRWNLAPVDDKESGRNGVVQQVHWFPQKSTVQNRLPLYFNPSGAEKIAAQVAEKCLVGERIPVRDGTDMSALGNAIHACIALSFADPSRLIEADEVERLLAGFGVADCIVASGIVRQTKALHEWIAQKWPNAKAFAEYPVQAKLDNGQVLNGRLDLLLDMGDGWILIDHKSSQLAADHWDQLAGDYGAQIAAYADAIGSVTERPVKECWLFLLVAGGAVRI